MRETISFAVERITLSPDSDVEYPYVLYTTIFRDGDVFEETRIFLQRSDFAAMLMDLATLPEGTIRSRGKQLREAWELREGVLRFGRNLVRRKSGTLEGMYKDYVKNGRDDELPSLTSWNIELPMSPACWEGFRRVLQGIIKTPEKRHEYNSLENEEE